MSSKNKLKKPNEEQSDSYDSDSSGDNSEAYNGNEVSSMRILLIVFVVTWEIVSRSVFLEVGNDAAYLICKNFGNFLV